MRKVFLDNLPRWKEGRYKGKIKWKETVGLLVDFIYDDVEGKIKILDYEKNIVLVQYSENMKRITTPQFINCGIGSLIGKHSFKHRYAVNEVLSNLKNGELRILSLERIENGGFLRKAYKYECLICGNKDTKVEDSLRIGSGCSVCSNQKIKIGFNDMWTTNPDLANLLLNPSDGYDNTQNNCEKVDWKCIDCGYIIKNKPINKVNQRGLCCPRCSDKISYPEKFMFSILEQLKVKFEYQKEFNWSQKKRYDFYLPDSNILIETHGGQHSKDVNFSRYGGRNLQEEQDNDKLKYELANEAGYDLITVDCAVSEMNYIKKSVLASELNTRLNTSKIDWLNCHKFAIKSLVKTTCDKWNGGIHNTTKLSEILGLSTTTISKYLKQGVKLGLCDYDPRKSLRIVAQNNAKLLSQKISRPIVQLDICGNYINEYSSIAKASDDLELSAKAISQSVRSKTRYSGGFLFYYKEDYEKEKEKIEKYIKTSANARKIIQLTLTGKYVNEWISAKRASEKTGVHSSGICLVCRNKQNSAGGYKWMYKEDYEKYLEDQKELVNQ